MKLRSLLFAFTLTLLAATAFARADSAAATAAPKLSALARMPVREVTIFKDDYAIVRHEGDMPTDSDGNVLMDYLPTPVLGTFWPYSSEPNARLVAVTSSRRRVEVDRTALTLKDMFRANIGADVIVDENGNKYSATIVGFPTRSSEELGQTAPPGSEEQLPVESDIVLLRTNEGVSAVPFDQISQVTFKNGQNALAPDQEFRNLLTLQLGWQGGHSASTAKVGLLYMQRGLKWTPSYRVTVDGAGNAHVELRATIVDDLIDLDDVTANLVIGVPTFKFKDTDDPIALQNELSGPVSAVLRSPSSSYNFSNAIQSQVAGDADDYWRTPAAPMPSEGQSQPDITKSEKTEDLFVFTVSHLTLKQGERVQMPVADYVIKYKDVYKLEVPIAPPAEISSNYNYSQRQQLQQEISTPHVVHAIRLINDSKFPITTAPALIVEGGSVLAQGMTTYTAVGDKSDLDITDAIDVPVTLKQHEVKRTPNSVTGNGWSYTLIAMTGSVCLTNYRSGPIDLEVNRYVMGVLDSADHDGTIEQSSLWDDSALFGGTLPDWWGWYNWPDWWGQYNGTGKASWKLTLDAGKPVELGYVWHYYMRQ